MTPLIYTSKGNLPISDLAYRTEWEDSPEHMIMAEIYEHEGEVVRRSVHVYKKQGAAIGAAQAEFQG